MESVHFKERNLISIYFFVLYFPKVFFFWHVVYKFSLGHIFFMSHATHLVYLEIGQFQFFYSFATSVNLLNLTFIDCEPRMPACSYHNSLKCFYQ